MLGTSPAGPAGASGWAAGRGPAAALGVGLMFIPESPRWLASRGQVQAARLALERMREPDEVDRELNDVLKGVENRPEAGSWRELLSRDLRPAMVVGVVLAVAQQATGINTVIYYAPTIFRSAGLASSSAAILASVGVGLVNVAMTVVAMQLIDRVGRRPLLLISLAGMSVSLFALGLAFALPRFAASLGRIAVVSLTLYVAAFAVGLGPVFWLLLSEIYPQRVRGRAMSISTVTNWTANLVVALSFLTLVKHLGSAATFWLYAAVSIGSWLFAFFMVPETRGKTLEQIEAIWRVAEQPPTT